MQRFGPPTQKQIALGTSSTVTPTGFSLSGRRIAVPLGNAASVALINLETQTIARFYTFTSGNTTGSAFIDDTTIVAANTNTNVLGKMTVGQASDAITTTVTGGRHPLFGLLPRRLGRFAASSASHAGLLW